MGGVCTHTPQIYCFSPVFGDFLLFRVYSLNYSYIVLLVSLFSRFLLISKAVTALLQQIRWQRHSFIVSIKFYF